MNRFTQVLALGLLMLASTVALADRDSERGRYYGEPDGNQNQQYGRHDGDRGYNNHGNKHGNRHGNKHAYKDRGDRYYDRHHNRRYARHDRNRYRHRHHGGYCNVRHAPGYAYQYGGPAFYPAPPAVVLYPPRPRIYFGGTIVF